MVSTSHFPAFPVRCELIAEGGLCAITAGLIVAGGDRHQVIGLNWSANDDCRPIGVGGNQLLCLQSGNIHCLCGIRFERKIHGRGFAGRHRGTAGWPTLEESACSASAEGAASFRVLCESVGITDAKTNFQTSGASVRGSHPCKERKDGAPSVVLVSKKERWASRRGWGTLFGGAARVSQPPRGGGIVRKDDPAGTSLNKSPKFSGRYLGVSPIVILRSSELCKTNPLL